jgi:phosphoheptose isomerase
MTDTNFFDEYITKINDAARGVDDSEVFMAFSVLLDAYRNNVPIYVIGNGGSAAISEHFACDHTKGIQHDTHLTSKVISLASNAPLMLAISNDYSFEDVFAKQVEYLKDTPGVLLAISSSGNSPNIVKALKQAREQGWKTLAFIGFDGGKIYRGDLADYMVRVNTYNYGVVEDVHQMLMHALAQKIRTNMATDPSNLKL